MAHKSNKQLEALRHTVTGIGWANPHQAAIYMGIAHRDVCEMVASGVLVHSRIGQRNIRMRYSDLDEYMISKRSARIDIGAIVDDVMEGLKCK